jgi:hypothetical protein
MYHPLAAIRWNFFQRPVNRKNTIEVNYYVSAKDRQERTSIALPIGCCFGNLFV